MLCQLNYIIYYHYYYYCYYYIFNSSLISVHKYMIECKRQIMMLKGTFSLFSCVSLD